MVNLEEARIPSAYDFQTATVRTAHSSAATYSCTPSCPHLFFLIQNKIPQNEAAASQDSGLLKLVQTAEAADLFVGLQCSQCSLGPRFDAHLRVKNQLLE